MADSLETKVEIHEDSDDKYTDVKDVLRAGRREQKLTTKGLEYQQDLKKTRLIQLSRVLAKISDQIKELVNSGNDEEVKSNYQKWVTSYGEFLSVDIEYRHLLDPDGILEYEAEYFTSRQQMFLEFKYEMEEWFSSQQEESYTDERTVLTSVSRARSKRSSKSSASIMSARLEQERKKAELIVRAEHFKRKQDMEEAKLRLRMEEEEMQLQEEIAINEAHRKVLDDLDQRSMRSVSRVCSDSAIKPYKYDRKPLPVVSTHIPGFTMSAPPSINTSLPGVNRRTTRVNDPPPNARLTPPTNVNVHPNVNMPPPHVHASSTCQHASSTCQHASSTCQHASSTCQHASSTCQHASSKRQRVTFWCQCLSYRLQR